MRGPFVYMGKTRISKTRRVYKTYWKSARFLPPDHPYRRSKTSFTKNKQVFDGPPEEVSGKDLLKQFRYFDAERTPDVGGHENI